MSKSPSESLPPLEARVSAVFVVMIASWAGVTLPLFASKCGHGPGIVVLKCGSLFGAGVLLATALVHMLFPAMENLTHPCLSAFFTALGVRARTRATFLATLLIPPLAALSSSLLFFTSTSTFTNSIT